MLWYALGGLHCCYPWTFLHYILRLVLCISGLCVVIFLCSLFVLLWYLNSLRNGTWKLNLGVFAWFICSPDSLPSEMSLELLVCGYLPAPEYFHEDFVSCFFALPLRSDLHGEPYPHSCILFHGDIKANWFNFAFLSYLLLLLSYYYLCL